MAWANPSWYGRSSHQYGDEPRQRQFAIVYGRAGIEACPDQPFSETRLVVGRRVAAHCRPTLPDQDPQRPVGVDVDAGKRRRDQGGAYCGAARQSSSTWVSSPWRSSAEIRRTEIIRISHSAMRRIADQRNDDTDRIVSHDRRGECWRHNQFAWMLAAFATFA